MRRASPIATGFTFCFVGVLTMFVPPGALGQSLTLVRDGRPAAVIVVADQPSQAARIGASELQMWLRKASGATVPIRRESQLGAGTTESLILVGDTQRTAALGIRSAEFELEEIRVRTFPGALVLVGDDARPDGVALMGTLWAVERFAESELGVRVLWPGRLGLVVPERKTIEVGKISIRYVPPLRQRRIRNLGYNERLQRGLDKLGWSGEAYRRHHAEAAVWFRFHRIGGSFRGRYGHAFGDYWERFHRDHPDWFALQPDGTRDNSRAHEGRRARLCVSNRELIEQVARDAIARLRRDPTLDCASISPNDGGRATFCLCPRCEAWDAPDGPMIKMWGPDGPIEHVSLTDRFVRFYSAVAEIVARELPDRYLGAYAYSAYRRPPVRAHLHPNVIIGFVPGAHTYLNEAERRQMRQDWLEWSKAARHLFLRPNFLRAAMGMPTVYVHRLAEDMRFFVGHGLLVTDFDCCEQHWATDGLNYYVLARLLWNPALDVEAVVRDYCRAGFGRAAPAIVEYFGEIEKMTTSMARSDTFKERRPDGRLLARYYSDDFLQRCNRLLDEARRLAREDPIVLERIEFLRKAIEYARIRRDLALARAAVRSGDRAARKRLAAIERRCQEWYQNLGLSWALNAARLRSLGY